MAERFGIVAIKNGLVTLLGTTNVSDLNSGLGASDQVKQVITVRPDPELKIPDTKYPTVNVWVGDSVDATRGASKRKEVRVPIEIWVYVRKMGSVDSSIDDVQNLADNVRYIVDSNMGFVANGQLETKGVKFFYGDSANGFMSKARIDVEAFKMAIS